MRLNLWALNNPEGPRYCCGAYSPKSFYGNSEYRNPTFYDIGTLDPSGKYNRLLQYTIVSTRINSYKDA